MATVIIALIILVCIIFAIGFVSLVQIAIKKGPGNASIPV